MQEARVLGWYSFNGIVYISHEIAEDSILTASVINHELTHQLISCTTPHGFVQEILARIMLVPVSRVRNSAGPPKQCPAGHLTSIDHMARVHALVALAVRRRRGGAGAGQRPRPGDPEPAEAKDHRHGRRKLVSLQRVTVTARPAAGRGSGGRSAARRRPGARCRVRPVRAGQAPGRGGPPRR